MDRMGMIRDDGSTSAVSLKVVDDDTNPLVSITTGSNDGKSKLPLLLAFAPILGTTTELTERLIGC